MTIAKTEYIGEIEGDIVSMLVFKEKIYIASTKRVYVVEGRRLVPLEFVFVPQDGSLKPDAN